MRGSGCRRGVRAPGRRPRRGGGRPELECGLQLAWPTLVLPPAGDPRHRTMTAEQFVAALRDACDVAGSQCMLEVYGTDDPRELAEAMRTGEWGADSVAALFAYADCMEAAGCPLGGPFGP